MLVCILLIPFIPEVYIVMIIGFFVLVNRGERTMIVYQILNNNLVLSRDENGNEIIVKGKGVGFQKSKGDTVDESRAEKIFTFDKTKEGKRFQSFISSISPEYISITDKIVDYALVRYDLKLSDSIYIALSDHLEGVCDRYSKGIQMSNALLFDVQRMYTKEYDIGKYALDVLKREKNIDLKNDEAGYIAMHFINAQTEGNMDDIYFITQIVGEVLDLVQSRLQMAFDDENYNYQRFLIHLKFFAQRLLLGKTFSADDDGLYEVIKEKYPDVYQCVAVISNHIEEKYHYNMGKEEMLYLMIHIERIKSKN